MQIKKIVTWAGLLGFQLGNNFASCLPIYKGVKELADLDKRSLNITTISGDDGDKYAIFEPKVMIISMFGPEQNVWINPLSLTNNISIPGLSPVYPEIHCNNGYEICQITTGEAEINAATTISALLYSPLFNLKHTFFLVAGIAGINPYQGTLGSATFPRFAVQVALEYEIDARQMPKNWTTGYVPLGSDEPNAYPKNLYGSEIYELNVKLRDRAIYLARGGETNTTINSLSIGSNTAQSYRSLYNYAPANQNPQVVACDTVTSDAYWTGNLLGESFGNYTSMISNGSAVYCTTQQEDNATLQSMLRAAKSKIIDFGRIVILRTASDFDRSPPSTEDDEIYNLLYAEQGGFSIAIENLLIAGTPFVNDVINNFKMYDSGAFAPSNYIGDIFGTLGGVPDFGPYGQ